MSDVESNPSQSRRSHAATSADMPPPVDADRVLEALREQAERCEQGFDVDVQPFLVASSLAAAEPSAAAEDLDPKIAIMHACRTVREQGKWTDAHREQLHKLLTSMQAKDAEALDNLEAFNMNLQNDEFQHEMDVHMALRMCFGLSCLFVACQMPWIVSVVVILEQWLAVRPAVALEDQYDAALPMCDSIAGYLIGFFVIFAVNVTLGVIFTLARSVDGANNALVSATPFVTAVMSISIISFNMYGIVVVWRAPLWARTNVPAECYSMLVVSTACICMFLAVPCLYYSVVALLRVSGNVATNVASASPGTEEPLHDANAAAAGHQVTFV